MQTEDLGLYKNYSLHSNCSSWERYRLFTGRKEEKLRPWMQPIFDNLEYLFNTKTRRVRCYFSWNGFDRSRSSYVYTRRSIPDQFIIIDEAQNLTKHEVKTILTRVGEKVKSY